MANSELITELPEFVALLPWAKAVARAEQAEQLEIQHVLKATLVVVRAQALSVPDDVRAALERSVGGGGAPAVSQPVQEKLPVSAALKAALVRGAGKSFVDWLGDLLGLVASPSGAADAEKPAQVTSDPEYQVLRPWLFAAMRSLGQSTLTLPAMALALRGAIQADALAGQTAFAHWCEGHLDELSQWLSFGNYPLDDLTLAQDDGDIALDAAFTQVLDKVNVQEHAPSATWKWVHAVIQAANEDNRQRQVAYHEAGHAVALHVLSPETVFTKITIEPEGNKGGYVAPDRNSSYDQGYLNSLEHAMETVVVALAGRAAEVHKFDEVRADSGATSDMRHATTVAWLAITAFGLDPDFGLLSLAGVQGLEAQGGFVVPMAPTGWLQDLAQKRLHAWLQWGMQEARALVNDCWPLVDELARVLMQHKTLDNAQAREALGRWRAGSPPYSLRSVPSSLNP